MNVYKRLKQLLNQKQKRQVLLLIFMIFVSALLETLGVSIIVPLISAVVTPEKLLENETVQKIFTIFGVAITDKTFFVKLLLLCTMGIFLLKNIYLLFLYYIQARFVTKTEATTSIRLLNEYLNRPYEFYLNADVNAMFQTINKDIPHVFELLQEVMKLLTEIAVSMCLCTLLFVVDFKMSLSISVLLLLMVLFIVFVLKPKLGNLGQGRLKQQVLTMKWMQQGIFGIKDVKVAAKEKYFLGKFADAYTRLAGIIRKYTVFNNAPRLVIETVCIVGLLGYMFLCIVKGEDMSRLLPQLTAFALAAVRLMPSVNRISTHLSTIAYYEPSLNFVCDNLNIAELKDVEEKTSAEVMELKHSIELKEITYAYPNTDRKIFDRASMNIPVGQSVGVIGTKQTVNSGIYPASITALNATMQVKALATPLLVPMIEEGFLHNRIAHDIIDKYLGDAALEGIDSLVLGCTHYPLIKKEISAYYKESIKVLDSSTVTAEFLKNFLINNNLLNNTKEEGNDRFFVSDLTDSFAHSAKLFFGEPVVLEKYQLWE